MAEFRTENAEWDVQAMRNAPEGRIAQPDPFKKNASGSVERDIVKQHGGGERKEKKSRLLTAEHIVGLRSGG